MQGTMYARDTNSSSSHYAVPDNLLTAPVLGHQKITESGTYTLGPWATISPLSTELTTF